MIGNPRLIRKTIESALFFGIGNGMIKEKVIQVRFVVL